MPVSPLRPMPKRQPAASAPAPVWQGNHAASRLYCADQRLLLPTLAAESVDCVWNGQRRKVNKGEWDRSHGWAGDHAFHLAWLAECQRVLTPAGTLWVSGTTHVYLSVGMALMELGFRILNDIVWEKPNPPPNLGCRCFTHSTEIILWATKSPKGSQHRHVFNYAEMKRRNEGRQMKNVWRLPAPGASEKRHGRHPTQKPVALIERCLEASTLPGHTVLDPFAGTGSTGVAALAGGRHFIGCEVEPQYAQIASARLAETQHE